MEKIRWYEWWRLIPNEVKNATEKESLRVDDRLIELKNSEITINILLPNHILEVEFI